MALSNVIIDGVPAGGEDDFVVLDTVGTPRDFAAEGFEPRDHLELGRLLGAIDSERGAKGSGARFYCLTGPGARLELGLLTMAIAKAVEHGFTPMVTPTLVKPDVMAGAGFLDAHASEVYHLEEDDLYLTGTSEVALAGYHANEIIDLSNGPKRYAGWSACYRREAGSYGKDKRGIFRVHWFDKVEMFVFTTPEEAAAEHERLLGWERAWLDLLELPYRVIDVAAGDLGLSAVRKFDCEAWIPTQERYREVSSASNCTQFQARRLDIRVREGDSVSPLATLNGTLCAMTRTIVALLENGQQPDGSVRLPAALHPFIGEVLEPIA
jgi:seryl-tRNA synthetase